MFSLPLTTPTEEEDAIRKMTSSVSLDSGDWLAEDPVTRTRSSSEETIDSNATALLKGRAPPKPVRHGAPRSDGKVVRRRGKMRSLDHPNEDIKCDHDDEATGDLELPRFQATKLRNSACEIGWSCFDGSGDSHYVGQGGLVRGPDGTVKFLTANHNICSENNREGVWEEPRHGHTCLTFKGMCKKLLYIPRTAWERTDEWTKKNAYSFDRVDNDGNELTWKYGVDISLGPELSTNDRTATDMLQKLRVNDVVPDDFVYEAGTKVGMAIFTNDGPNYKEEEIVNNDIDAGELPEILGRAKELLIFTGQITGVGREHIEHDVNAFGGCSGGHLIVLEKGHPHYGKVLAVHVGYKVEIGSNIAFKVAKVFDRY